MNSNWVRNFSWPISCSIALIISKSVFMLPLHNELIGIFIFLPAKKTSIMRPKNCDIKFLL